MIGKILLATKGKPCSCPTDKICTACKNKKGVRVKPRVIIEGSNDLPVPIKITTYKNTIPTTVQLLEKRKTWSRFQKQAPIESANRGTKICQWYRRRKALRELKKLTELERKRIESLRLEKARRERETEFLELLRQREKEIRQAEQQREILPKKTVPYFDYPRNQSSTKQERFLFKDKKKKLKKIKGTEAKPTCESRCVSTKSRKQHHKDSLNERFVKFCYRICCQFYCCVTIILIIGFIIIFIY